MEIGFCVCSSFSQKKRVKNGKVFKKLNNNIYIGIEKMDNVSVYALQKSI